jgi:hypothetical protein
MTLIDSSSIEKLEKQIKILEEEKKRRADDLANMSSHRQAYLDAQMLKLDLSRICALSASIVYLTRIHDYFSTMPKLFDKKTLQMHIHDLLREQELTRDRELTTKIISILFDLTCV